jgi:hypothetical protein
MEELKLALDAERNAAADERQRRVEVDAANQQLAGERTALKARLDELENDRLEATRLDRQKEAEIQEVEFYFGEKRFK